MSRAGWRLAAFRLLLVLATLCLVGGTAAGVAHREVLDGPRFDAHIDRIRTDPAVAREVGEQITAQVLAIEPDLVVLRPLIEAAAAALVASPAFRVVISATVTPLHRSLVSDDGGQVVLMLADIGTLLAAMVTSVSPDLADKLPADLDVTLSQIGVDDTASRLVEVVQAVDLLVWLLPLAGLLLALLAAVAMPDRGDPARACVRTVGNCLLAAAAVVALLLLLGAFWVARTAPDSLVSAVLVAAWDQLDNAFWLATALVAAGGYLVRLLAAGASGIWAPQALYAQAVRWVRTAPDTAAGLLRRGGIFAMGGLLLIARPTTVASAAVAVAGFLLVVRGALDATHGVERLRLPSLSLPRIRRWAERHAAGDHGRDLVAAVVAIALVGVLATVAAWPTADRSPASAAGTTCNGYAELCERRYDEVAYPATHNSMSAADQPGWFFAEQPTGVLGQLEDGIRVFLIDSWYGQATQRPGIVAPPDSTREKALQEANATYGEAAVQSALRLRQAVGLQPRGPVEPYLCHAMCELGATKWEPLMQQVKTWLDAHPREVVTFIVQDEVSPADTAALVERAGLLPSVHTQEAGRPWPTLGELIDSGRRVVFFMENRAGGSAAPWLMDVNAWVQDTPFHYGTLAEFDCRPNRGRRDASLLLLNHWLDDKTKRVSNAALGNAADVLTARIAKCRSDRKKPPNFVAVDFYDQGDIFQVVNELNRVS